MATKFGIFSTRIKGFEAEFTAKSSLKVSLTINMALSQRISQVGKDPYLLELSELHQIGVHAQPSLRRATLLLAPSRTDGLNDRKSREKEHFLSLKFHKPNLLHIRSSPFCTFPLFVLRRQLFVCLILIKHFKNSHHVPKFWILTLGTI